MTGRIPEELGESARRSNSFGTQLSLIKITIIHVQCVKNNFKQPFQVLWGLSRSLLIRKPVVSTQTPFSQTTQPWLISVTSSIYEFWHEHERHFEHVLCFLSQVHETFYTSTETTCIDRETILYRNDRCLGHGHSSIQKVIDRNQGRSQEETTTEANTRSVVRNQPYEIF